jgi:hypothetical protein
MDWGARWKEKLISSSDDAVFLIPIITPSYFESEPCREELKQFVDRESATGFKESILPLYYIDTPKLKDGFEKAADLLAKAVAAHNYEDIRELRHCSITSYEAKQKIKKLATALVGRLEGYARRQLSAPSMRAEVTAPPKGAKVPRQAPLSGMLGKHFGRDGGLACSRNRYGLPSAKTVSYRQRTFSILRSHWAQQQ